MTDWLKDTDVDFCFSCNEKSEVNEDGQCETCFDDNIVECYQCSDFGSKEDYKDAEDGDWMCEDCYTPTCKFCNEEVEEEGDFCCDDCAKGYQWDNYREK